MKANAEPMVRLNDLRQALDGLCPNCDKKVREALLQSLAERRGPATAPLALLRRKSAAAFGIDECRFLASDQSRLAVSARRDFCRRADRLGYSLNEIGRSIGRHHTTVHSLLGRRKGC